MEIKLLVLVSLVSLVHCGENSVTISVKKAVNSISDSFISYEFDIQDLVELYREQKSLGQLKLAAPAYIKLRGFSTYLKNDKETNETEVAMLLQTLKYVIRNIHF